MNTVQMSYKIYSNNCTLSVSSHYLSVPDESRKKHRTAYYEVTCHSISLLNIKKKYFYKSLVLYRKFFDSLLAEDLPHSHKFFIGVFFFKIQHVSFKVLN